MNGEVGPRAAPLNSPIFEILRQARQRTIVNLVLEQASLALTLALGAGILLLILGTQILDWYWPVLLFVGALGYGWYRYGRTLPTDYTVAQRLDVGLGLPDTISTAFHFATAKTGNEGFRERQRALADETARSYRAEQAIPWRLTRYSYAAVAFAAVFGGLMMYRYAMERRLDLSRPMVPGVVDLFGTANTTVVQLPKQGPNRLPPGAEQLRTEDPANTQEGEKQEAASLGDAPEDVLKTISTPEVSNENSEQFKGKDETGQPGEGSDEQSAGSDKADGQSGEQSGDSKQASKDGKKEGPSNANAPQQPGGQQNEKNSMLDKMRDAFANLMNKMNLPQPKQGGEQMAKNGQKDGQQGQKGGQQQQQKGQPNQGKPSDQQGQGDQAGQQAEAQAGQQQQTAQGKGSSDSNDAGSDQPKSGMGKSDGQKDVKIAEQMQALGKLSEIIGKRSERQQGEIMVEVSSSKNQGLRTAYGAKTSKAANSGGEIHRDEVPLIYQQYVQQYFEQIRKAPAAAAPKAN